MSKIWNLVKSLITGRAYIDRDTEVGRAIGDIQRHENRPAPGNPNFRRVDMNLKELIDQGVNLGDSMPIHLWMGDTLKTLRQDGSCVIAEISRKDLKTKRASRIKTLGCVDMGDWDALSELLHREGVKDLGNEVETLKKDFGRTKKPVVLMYCRTRAGMDYVYGVKV